MSEKRGFSKDGNWYRGNLHCHTSNSDGELHPDEVIRRYQEAGYHFLAITDHNRFTDSKQYNKESFILIPGIEVDTAQPDPLRIYHCVGIPGKDSRRAFADGEAFKADTWEGIQSAQKLIEELSEKGMMSFFCHPVWSRLDLEDYLDLDGCFSLEIYNHGCEMANRTGLAVRDWDSLLRRGRRIWGIATDDCHHRIDDRFGGWVMVKAPRLTEEEILKSLMQGNFYSSSGPEIYDFGVRDGQVYVECSPVREIHFVCYEHWGKSIHAGEKGTINAAVHKLTGKERYVRAECVDSAGRTAWSNPIFLNPSL